jgi:autonomous glycyl radical cofactor GrcA
VPKAFTEKDEMIWSLTAHGVTEKAWASLRPDYLLDDVVKASETGALGAGTSSPEVRSNQPPTVKVEGSKTLSVKVGQPLTIATIVTDDGIPKPRVTSPLLALFGGSARGTTGGPATGAAAGGSAGAASPTAGPGTTGAAGTGGNTGANAAAGTSGATAPAAGNAAPGSNNAAAGAGLAAIFGFGGRGGGGGEPDIAALAARAGLSPAQIQQIIAARKNPELQPPARITVGKVTDPLVDRVSRRRQGDLQP